MMNQNDYAKQIQQEREQREQAERRWRRKMTLLIGGGIAALFLLLVLLGCFYTVDATERAVVTRFGAITHVAGPGLHGKAPFVDDVTRIPVSQQAVEWSFYRGEKGQDTRMESYSYDQQPAHLSFKVTWRPLSDAASISTTYAQYRDEEHLKNTVLVPRIYEAVKSTFGRYNAAEVIQNRARFNADVEQAIRALIDGKFPLVLDGVQVQDIKFADAYEKAVEERMTAQVEVARVEQNLNRERKNAEITVVQADAKRDAVKASADAEAYATRVRGEAEAQAIRVRAQALRENPNLVSLTTAERWNGVLPQTMLPSGATPMVKLP